MASSPFNLGATCGQDPNGRRISGTMLQSSLITDQKRARSANLLTIWLSYGWTGPLGSNHIAL
jgi:hypothetical protein